MEKNWCSNVAQRLSDVHTQRHCIKLAETSEVERRVVKVPSFGCFHYQPCFQLLMTSE